MEFRETAKAADDLQDGIVGQLVRNDNSISCHGKVMGSTSIKEVNKGFEEAKWRQQNGQ